MNFLTPYESNSKQVSRWAIPTFICLVNKQNTASNFKIQNKYQKTPPTPPPKERKKKPTTKPTKMQIKTVVKTQDFLSDFKTLSNFSLL